MSSYTSSSPNTSLLGRFTVGQKIAGLVLLLVLAFVIGSMLAWTLSDRRQQASQFSEQVSVLSEQVRYLDEVLTMSARMAAVTGDPRWIQRYEQHADDIDRVIDRLIVMAPEQVAADFEASTAVANEALFAEEGAAFEAVNRGELIVAQGILFGQAYEGYKQALDQGTDRFLEAIAVAQAERLAELDRYGQLVTLLMFAVLLLAILLSVLIMRSIVHPLQYAVTVANRIAGGDLTEEPVSKARDETGQLLRSLGNMVIQLRELMAEVTDSANSMASASEQLSAISARTREGAEKQADQTTQVATSMNEMTLTVQEVARSAQEVQTSAERAGEQAGKARTVVHRSGTGIQRLAGEVERATAVIRELEQQGESIGEVLTMIRSIADQTNLLALNAAIEAARAGEHGRGFAVVSDEVRKLASNTQTFIGEIDDIIQSLHRGTRDAVEVMTAGNDSARVAVADAGQAVAALDDILQVVDRISGVSTQVASAAEEQALAAEEINRNVLTINDVASETTQAVQEVASSSQELARLAGGLEQRVSRFRLL